MTTETTAPQAEILTADWQMWLVLRHFLPARLQRILLVEVVRVATRGTIRFNELFESIHSDEHPWNETWMLRPLPSDDRYASSLKSVVRSCVWQNDYTANATLSGERDDRGFMRIEFLDALLELALVDYSLASGTAVGLIRGFSTEPQPNLAAFVSALEEARKDVTCRDATVCWQPVLAAIERMGMPLRAVTLKHLADLFAHADNWTVALFGYERTLAMLVDWDAPAELAELSALWQSLTLQSAFGAEAVTLPRPSPSARGARLRGISLEVDPVLAANAGLDATLPRLDAGEFVDHRVAQLVSPLLHASHDSSVAVDYWLRGKHDEASRRFWALVRRKVALGSWSEIQALKAHSARNLFEWISKDFEERDSEGRFTSAVQLLIESERYEDVARVPWSRALVDKHISSPEMIDGFVAYAMAHEGSRLPRLLVLIDLFKAWALALTPSREPLVVAMWKHIAGFAQRFAVTFESGTDVGRGAMKALQDLARKRPELRGKVAVDVSTVVSKKLQERQHWARAEAAEVANAYSSAIDVEGLRSVVTAVVTALEAEPAARNFWPFTRPALRLLVQADVRRRLRDDTVLGRRCLEQILRFGTESESEQMMLFFHIADFDERLFEDASVKERLKEPLLQVRARAAKTNESSITGNIQALLVAPAVSGPDGLKDAIDGLIAILESARGQRRSMGLPHIDGPLFVLTAHLGALRSTLAARGDWLEATLGRIAEALAKTWELAAEDPTIFASFAIPARTEPNPVVTHNCALASLRFARAVGQAPRVEEGIAKASENRALRRPILLARATDASHPDFALLDPGPDKDVDRDAHYQALGRRLTQLHRLPQDAALDLCKRLIAATLRFGPDAADASVFLAAMHFGLQEYVRTLALTDYALRVGEDKVFGLLLLPILDLFGGPELDEG